MRLPRRLEPQHWKYASPSEPGWHRVVSPENSPCRSLWFFRLNLAAGQGHQVVDDSLELSAVVISGRVRLEAAGCVSWLNRLDSFYLPAACPASLACEEPAVLYFGGGLYEGIGEFYTRSFDLSLPLGEIHQIHGHPPMRREVFMTCNPEVAASRIMTGLSWSDPGGWSSWPPHQHEEHLEEAYFYFDMDGPHFGLHLSYLKPGRIDAVHVVQSGDCVISPRGYQTNVAPPGFRNSYFWLSAAHSHASRRFTGVAVNDPHYG